MVRQVRGGVQYVIDDTVAVGRETEKKGGRARAREAERGENDDQFSVADGGWKGRGCLLCVALKRKGVGLTWLGVRGSRASLVYLLLLDTESRSKTSRSERAAEVILAS